jgi:hypothetical protein
MYEAICGLETNVMHIRNDHRNKSVTKHGESALQ